MTTRKEPPSQDEPPDWENPRVTSRNRRAAHTPLYAFRSVQEARLFWQEHGGSWDAVKRLSNVLSLCEEDWRFALFDKPQEVPDEALGASCADSSWDTIPVPSNWMLTQAGKEDVPIYTNQMYCFPLDPPRARRKGNWEKRTDFLPSDQSGAGTEWLMKGDEPDGGVHLNPTGVYRRRFAVPPDWMEAGRVFLVFEGVESAFYCWLNGSFVGYSQDSRLPAEFDVTDFVRFDETNALAVQVMRFSDGSYLEDQALFMRPQGVAHPAQDQWWMAGIHRNVYLYRKQAVFIADYTVRPHILNRDVAAVDLLSPATLDVEVCFEESPVEGSKEIEQLSVRMHVFNSQGECVEKCQRKLTTATRYKDKCAVTNLSVQMPEAHLWCPERPYLYTVVVDLLDENNSTMDIEGCRVGFKKVETMDGQLRINGRAIKVAGINHHEHHDSRGKAITEDDLRQDIEAIKVNNFNAVRASHYPHHARFYELCDELGLYVCDEANIETHGFRFANQPVAFLANQPEWKNSFVERILRMYERNKNHVSIIMWSLGNESGCGAHHYEAASKLRARDSSRLLHYESGGIRVGASDVICPMYARVKTISKWSKDKTDKRPVILCEYSHAMNNSNGNLWHYWKAFNENPRLQGGFIWDWKDQGLLKTSPDGFIYWAYGGDFDDVPNDGPFCINGVTFPDRSPKPALEEAFYVQQPIHFECIELSDEGYTMSVRNCHQFIDLSGYRIEWIVANDAGRHLSGGIRDLSSMNTVRPGGVLNLRLGHPSTLVPSGGILLPPGGEAWVTAQAKSIYDTKWCKAGTCFAREQLHLPLPTGVEPPPLPEKDLVLKARPAVHYSNDNIQIVTETGLKVTLAKWGEYAGSPSSLVHKGVELARGGPAPCFYRARTSNDRGGEALSFSARWLAAGLNSLKPLGKPVFDVVHPDNDTSCVVSSEYVLAAGESSGYPRIKVKSNYVAESDGNVACHFHVKVPRTVPSLARIGAITVIPSAFSDHVEWLGRGPHECYPDRKASALLGRYRKHLADMGTAYVMPSENGGRADCRYFVVSDEDGRKGMAFVPSHGTKPMQACASPHSVQELDLAQHQSELRSIGSGPTHVHMDLEHHGIGGDDSWTPSTWKNFRVGPGDYAFSITLSPINEGGNVDPDDIYRSVLCGDYEHS